MQKISHQTARAAAAPGTDRDALFARKSNEIPDNQEITHKPHLTDNFQFMLQPRNFLLLIFIQFRGVRIKTEAFFHTLDTKFTQVAFPGLPLPGLVHRIMIFRIVTDV